MEWNGGRSLPQRTASMRAAKVSGIVCNDTIGLTLLFLYLLFSTFYRMG